MASGKGRRPEVRKVEIPEVNPEHALTGGMDNALRGDRMKEIFQFVQDVAYTCYDGNGGPGDHVPAIRELGQRADDIRSEWLGTFNLESPPNKDAIVGFSMETEDCIQEMREVSTRLAGLLLRDFGEVPAV